MRASVILTVLAAPAALVACDNKPDAGKAPAETPGASAPPAPASYPKRKVGLWEQSMSMAGSDQVTSTSRMCLDAATEEKLSFWGGQGTRDLCPETKVNRTLTGWEFSSVCNMGSGGTTTTKGVASGDFDKHYEVKAQTATTGAALDQMNVTQSMIIVSDYQGPCPEGMRGGDVELPGGMRINIVDATAAMAPAKPK